ncbi:MAG: tetratricopeptide repeat protein [Pseudomonadota bacterium]
MTTNLHRSMALAVLLALCAGCSLTQPPAGVGAEPSATKVPSAPSAPGTSEPEMGAVHPAAAQFLADARNWRKLNNTPRAAASMERAIRIDPRHPEPWLELARLRYEGGDISQAENLALKARSLAPRDSEWFAAAEDLLISISTQPR